MDDDVDQRIHDLENAHGSLEVQVRAKDASIRELEASNTDLKRRLEQTMADLQREKTERAAAQVKVDASVGFAADKEAALRTVDELRRQSKHQEDSFDALEKETEKLQAKVREAEQGRADAVDDAAAKAREASTVIRRADSLQKQCTELERELDERTKALAEYRGQKSEELMQAMSELAAANRRVDDQKTRARSAETAADALRVRLERTEADVKDMSDKCLADKMGLEKQLELQERLTGLQRMKAEQITVKVTTLQRGMDLLKKQLTMECQNTDKERQRANTVRDKAKAVVDDLKAKLLEEEGNTKKAGAAAEAAVPAATGKDGAMAADAVPMDLSVDLNSLNDTELKVRMMNLERELEYVRSERDRNELYLKRILKEVDQKSALLMSNKKDYQRVLHAHEQLSLKVEDSMRRCQRAETEREAAATQRDLLEKELDNCKTSLGDAKAQVQRLLCGKLERDLGRPIDQGSSNGTLVKSTLGQPEGSLVPKGNIVPQEPDQLIADNLVTFTDIRELQERNILLVQVVRRLTTELEDSKVTRDMEQESADDRAVLQELTRQVENLKTDRERQADMLATVTSARDMYRVLLAQETNRDLGSTSVGGGGRGASAATLKAAVEETEAMKSRVHELERDVGLAREDTSKMQKSLRLMGDEVTTAERKESRAVSELAATQRMLSHSEDQVQVLTQARNSATEALETTTKKFGELTDNLIKLQEQVQREKNKVFDARDKVKDLSLTIIGLKADINIMQASEAQLREENATLRKDARRTDDVVNRLTQIDRSLGAKATAEVSTLREELSRLRRQAEDDRRRAVYAESEKEKAVSLGREGRLSLEKDLATAKAEASAAKQAATDSAATEGAAKEKAAQLGARLQEARSRLLTGAGAGDGDGGAGGAGDSSMSGQLAEVGKLQMELQATKVELKAKTEALSTNDRQRVQYEAIAKSKQQQLDQLISSKAKMQEKLEDSEKAALAKAHAAEDQVRETKTSLASTVAELIQDKDTAENEAKQQRLLVAQATDELERMKKNMAQEKKIVDGLKEEVEIQQKAVRAADERYRNELEAHAGAIAALRQGEQAQDTLKRERQQAREATAALAADLMRAKAQWEARERQLKQVAEAAEARLSGVNAQNEVLHSRLQTLTEQVEAAQARRESEDKAAVDKQLDGGDDAAGGGGSGSGSGSESWAAGEDGEKMRLARSVKELTELIRFNRRDMQVLSTNLEMSQQKASKTEAELERTKVSLREAREEVQKAARESADAVSKSQHNNLLEEVEQLSALRESNTMLRKSLRESENRARQISERAKKLEIQAAPLQQSERQNSAAAAALASEKESLKKEVESWKKRVTSLTASFNAVDPKEHEELKAAHAKLEQSLAESERAQGTLEKGKAELLRAKTALEKEKNDSTTQNVKMQSMIIELRKTLEGAKREATLQKTAATRDLETKLAVEKERANKAISDTQTARQEATRTRMAMTNAHNNTVKSLNDQVSKARVEIDSLKKQGNASRSQDTFTQNENLRKEVAKLQTKLEEVQRENIKNYQMYEGMKDINRKMKASVTTFHHDNAAKEEKIKELEASIAAATGITTAGASDISASAQSAPEGTSARPAPPTRSLSPAPGAQTARALSPARGGGGSALGGAGAGTAGVGGDDGSEASLRNKLMARTKRPLATTTSPEAAGPSKRVAPNSVAAAGGDTASGGAAGSIGTTAVSQVIASSFSTPGTSSFSSLSNSTSSTATTTSTSTFGSSTPLNPAATPFGSFGSGTFGSARRTMPGIAGGASNAPSLSTSGTGTGGVFGKMTWGRPSPAVTPVSTPSAVRALSISTPVGTTTTTTSTPGTSSFSTPTLIATGGSLSTTAPAGGVSSAEDRQASQGASKLTGSTMDEENDVSVVSDPKDGGVAMTSAGRGSPGATTPAGESGKDKESGGSWKNLSASGSAFGLRGVFGRVASITSGGVKDIPASSVFGVGGGFGRDVASMKPPNANSAFVTLPGGKLPVPEKAEKKENSKTAADTFSPITTTAPAAAPTFGMPTPSTSAADTTSAAGAPSTSSSSTTATATATAAATRPTVSFGAPAAPTEIKFGLSPSTAASSGTPTSFGAAVPRFGRPFGSAVQAAGSVAPGSGAAAAGASGAGTAAASGDTTAESVGGGRGGGNANKAVAAAASGVPGPGALSLDMDARIAARKARFEAPATAGQPAGGSAEARIAQASSMVGSTDPDAAAGNASHQSQKEDGEIDEDDDGDGDAL